MNEEIRDYLEAMEARFMARVDNAQEAIIERVRSCETSIAALTEVARVGNATMSLIAGLVPDAAKFVAQRRSNGG